MATLKEEALAYTSETMKNISELPEVSVNNVILEKEFTKEDGKKFKVKYIELAGFEFRVPVSVLSSLKTILEASPSITKFRVLKKGEGMSTEYTVLPLN